MPGGYEDRVEGSVWHFYDNEIYLTVKSLAQIISFWKVWWGANQSEWCKEQFCERSMRGLWEVHERSVRSPWEVWERSRRGQSEVCDRCMRKGPWVVCERSMRRPVRNPWEVHEISWEGQERSMRGLWEVKERSLRSPWEICEKSRRDLWEVHETSVRGP